MTVKQLLEFLTYLVKNNPDYIVRFSDSNGEIHNIISIDSNTTLQVVNLQEPIEEN